MINVTTSEPGRFEASAEGYEITDNLEMVRYFNSDIGDSEKLFVRKDSSFVYHIPLKRRRNGVPKSIAIYLRLFVSEELVVTKVFKSNPETDDNGSYFYAELPPPGLVK